MRPDPAVLDEMPFPVAASGADLLPEVTADTARHYDALDGNRLELQECAACGAVRYPAAPVCPHCFERRHGWRPMSGAGTVHSAVRYQRAFLPIFESLVPYVVLNVQLEGGPRVFGRLIGAVDVSIGDPVRAIVERWDDGRAVLSFAVGPVPE